MYLSTESLYPKSKEEIIKEAREYIDSLKEEGTLKAYYKSKIFRTPYDQQWEGLAFYSRNEEKFKEIRQYLLEKIQESYYENLPQQTEELLDLLSKDLDKFLKKIIFLSGSEEDFLDVPIFAYMNPEKFFKRFLSLKNSQKRKFINNIKERYGYLSIKSNLLKEKTFG